MDIKWGKLGLVPRLLELSGVQEHAGLQEGRRKARSSSSRRNSPTRSARSAAIRWSSRAASSENSWPAATTRTASSPRRSRSASTAPSAPKARCARSSRATAASSTAATSGQNATSRIWDKPLQQPCPQCKFPILTEKITKRAGLMHKCPQEGMRLHRDHRSELRQGAAA